MRIIKKQEYINKKNKKKKQKKNITIYNKQKKNYKKDELDKLAYVELIKKTIENMTYLPKKS